MQIDATLTFDIKKRPLAVADLLELLSLMRSGGYDVVVSSGGSTQVSILLFLSGIPIRVGYDSGKLAQRLLTVPVSLNKNQYAGDMYHDLARGLQRSLVKASSQFQKQSPQKSQSDSLREYQPTIHIPSVDVPDTSVQNMYEWLATGTAGGAKMQRIVLHPGMSKLALEKSIIKTWEPENWAALIRLLAKLEHTEIILAGGPDDGETVKQICALAPDIANLRNCFGVTKSLGDLAALINLCDVLVCVDSAPMHIGVGLRKKLVALFGPTDEAKLLPKNPRFIALRGSGTSPNTAFASAGAGSTSQPHSEHGVQLQPDIVFQSVMDQLREC